MNKYAFDLLDIAMVTIIIGLVISTSMSSLYMTRKNVLEDSLSYMEDKNTGNYKGFLTNEYSTYDGTLSKLEVVLISQIQDENMPYPRKMVINGLDVDIPFTYKEYAFDCGQLVWFMVKNQTDNTRYSLNYKFKVAGDGSLENEYYAVDKIITED